MSGDVSIPVAFFAGLISFLSPCVLPLMPPYLCYLAGTTLDQFTEQHSVPPNLQRKVVISSLLFVAGFTTVFILLGASASALGQLLFDYLESLSIIAGVIIIIMGLHFLGVFKIAFLYREARYHGNVRSGTYLGAYVMGLAFAFGWSPCIGPILALILALAASKETVYQGMVLLGIYSAGIGLPFVAAAFAVKPFLRFIKRFRVHMGTVEKAMGGLLVFAGVLFLTGYMQQFSFWLLESFPVLGTIG